MPDAENLVCVGVGVGDHFDETRRRVQVGHWGEVAPLFCQRIAHREHKERVHDTLATKQPAGATVNVGVHGDGIEWQSLPPVEDGVVAGGHEHAVHLDEVEEECGAEWHPGVCVEETRRRDDLVPFPAHAAHPEECGQG